MSEYDVPEVMPSWWGKLPLPPVRPRYVIVAVTGYSTGDAGQGRKPQTSWTVLDRLFQSKPVGIPHYREEYAEIERAEYEAAWERWLETGEWISPRSEGARREQHKRSVNRNHRPWDYRPWCGACKRKSRPGSILCNTCGRRLY